MGAFGLGTPQQVDHSFGEHLILAGEILSQRARDAEVENKLSSLGWRIGMIWECSIGKTMHVDLLNRIKRFLIDPMITEFERRPVDAKIR